MHKPIYEKMIDAINNDGVLDPSFSLPDEKPDKEIKFAPGAWDGVIIYHMGHGDFDPENKEYKSLVKIIKIASEGDIDRAIEDAERFSISGYILLHIDNLLNYIISNETELQSGNVMMLGYRLMVEGHKKETVKLGLAILELFDTNQSEDFKEPIRILALCDEFSFYAGFNMRSWEEGNEELFAAIKKVHGWGRIHLIHILEAETEEMKLWLLKNGVHNEVIPAYSGLDCYEKTDFISHLKRPMSHDLYSGMSDIIAALLDEGPVAGISEINEREELLQLFIDVTSKRKDLQAADYGTILDLINYLEDEESYIPLLYDKANKLLDENAKSIVTKELQQGKSFGIAKRMGLPYEPYAFRAVMENLEDNDWWAAQLIEDDYRADELLNYIEDSIDFEKYIYETPEYSVEQELRNVPDIFDFVLQALRHKVGTGEQFIRTGLVSWKRRLQNGAIKVIHCWIEDTGKSLEEISPNLHSYLTDVVKVLECEEDLKNQMIAIIKNTYLDEQNNVKESESQ